MQLKKLGVEWEGAEVDLSKEQLEKYEGVYNLFPNFDITIRVEGKRLFAQATGQQEFEIFPSSETKFYYKVVNAQIEFLEKDGEIYELILYQNGREMKGTRVTAE